MTVIKPKVYWLVASWTLLTAWIFAGALNMGHVKGGFLTNYLADLTIPPFLYIQLRGLLQHKRKNLLRWFGYSPERAAISIFLGSAGTELSQIYWPHGLFRGTYDSLDIIAYSAGLLICYYFDKRTS